MCGCACVCVCVQGAGVEHVCWTDPICVWACQCGFVSVYVGVILCALAVWCVCQVCKEPLICCPELVNNWHLPLITSSVKKVLSFNLLCSSVPVHTVLQSPCHLSQRPSIRQGVNVYRDNSFDKKFPAHLSHQNKHRGVTV